MEKGMEKTMSTFMLAAANVIKSVCSVRLEKNKSCKGCPFNKLVYMEGEYHDYEWTDEDDRQENNLTYCELYFGTKTAPRDWSLNLQKGNKDE